MKDHSFFRKRVATWIACTLLLAASLLVLPFNSNENQVEGATSIGTIRVTGGNTRSYTGVNYLLDGDIEVTGSGSKLTFTNSTVKLSQDVGNDGVIGGGDDHIYHIEVSGGGTLVFDNSLLTTETDQLHPYFMINITVSGSGSKLLIMDTIFEGPGTLEVSSSAMLEMEDSSFIELEDQDDLSYDIDGDDSSADDLDYNDDAISLELNSGGKGIIIDSELRDTFSFEVPSRDGLTAGNVTLEGSGTNLTVINSFLDIDLESNVSTGSHNILRLSGGAVAHLVGVSINDTSSSSSPAISVEDSSSKAVYYRWIAVRLTDGMDVQIEDHDVDLMRVEGSSETKLDSSYLTSDILDYMGRTSTTWNETDETGWLFVPTVTDVFTYSSMPNSEVTPDFRVAVEVGDESISRKTNFSSYPNLPSQDDEKNLFEAVLADDPFSDLIISDLNGPLSTSNYVVDPSVSNLFDGLNVDLTVGSRMSINGTGSFVDGKFYPSYYSFDGHLEVGRGGHLIINDTTVDFLTDEGPAYILIEDGGVVEMNNVTLRSSGNDDLYIYVMGASSPELSLTDGSIDVDYIVGRNTASIHLEAESIDSSMNLYGSSVKAYLDSPTIHIGDLYSVSNQLNLSGGTISIDDLDWKDVDLGSRDAVFDSMLEIDGSARLINVSYSGNRTDWLSVSGTGTIEKYYWASAEVVDSVGNSLPGSSISVDRSTGGGSTHITDITTDDEGKAHFTLLQERIDRSGRDFMGNYKLSATFRGYGSSSYSRSLSGSDIDARIVIPGGPNIVPGTIMSNGTLIYGNVVGLRTNVTNVGEFDSDSFSVMMKVNDVEIGMEEVEGLAAGDSKWLEFPWECQVGDIEFSVVVDPDHELNETGEEDNQFSQMNLIGFGPDYEITVPEPGSNWVFGERETFTLIVRNTGDLDPSESPLELTVTWNNEFGSGFIAKDMVMDYVPPGESVRIDLNWTPLVTGSTSLTASIDSDFDQTPSNSMVEFGFIIKTRPDLAVVSDSFEIGRSIPVTVNTTTEIEIEIRNMGEIPAGIFHVGVYDLTMDDDDYIILPTRVEGLEPGESTRIIIPWFAGLPLGDHTIKIVIDTDDQVKEQDETNNNFTIDIKVDTPPDIAITDDRGLSPSVVTEGKNTTIWSVIENIGNTKASDVLVHFAIDSDTNVIRSFTVDLYPGQSMNLSMFWIADGVGERRIFIVVDPLDRLVEEGSGEENNDAYIDFLVLSRPDLSMGENDLRVLPEGEINIDETVTLYASVRNTGQTDAMNVFVRFYEGDPDTGGKLIPYRETQPSVTIDSIPSKGSVQVEVPWTPVTGGWHDIFVVLDLSDLIEEDDESNNKESWDIYVQTLPDLIPENLTMLQGGQILDSAGIGKEITFNLTVTNAGDTMSPSFKVSFYNGDFVNDPLSEKISSDIMFPSNHIPGGSLTYIEFDWEVGYPKGIRTIYADVEIMDGREQSIDNNQLGIQIEIFDIEDVPELVPEEESIVLTSKYPGMSPSESGIGYLGTNITMIFNLSNIGGKVAPNTTIHFMVTNSTDTSVIYSTYSEFLMDNSSEAIMGFWVLDSLGLNTLSVVVDPENRVREFDEGNNRFETTIEVQEAPDLSVDIVESDSQGWDPDQGRFQFTMGDEYTLVYEINNLGNFTYQDVQVTFTGPSPEDEDTVTVSPYSTQRVTFTVKPETVYDGEVVWKCSVNENGNVYESDSENNEATSQFLIKEKEESPNYLLLIIIIVIVLILLIAAVGFFVYKRLQTSEMAKCSNCGGLVALDADLCPHCGVEFSDELECECGESIPKDATECPACGKPVGPGLEEPSEEEEETEEPADEEVAEESKEEEEETGEEEETSEPEAELEEMEKEIEEVSGTEEVPSPPEELGDEEEVAECFECGALIPVSAPICPHCGAVFE